MADCREQVCPERIGKGGGWTMSLHISIGFLMAFKLASISFISGHLDGEAVDVIDVENVLGRVAKEEGAANEKKHSTKAAQKRRNLVFVETTSISAKEIFWSYLVSAKIRRFNQTSKGPVKTLIPFICSCIA